MHAWVSDFLVGARAHRAVVMRSAKGVDSAGPRYAARISARALDARLVERTVLVDAASEDAPCADTVLLQTAVVVGVAFDLDFLAVNASISFEVLRTPALGSVAESLALRIDSASSRNARILADSIAALEEEVTVAVRTASDNAAGVLADLSAVAVVVGGAEFGRCTLSPKADETGLAFFVDAAVLRFLALELSVSGQSRWAETVCAMILWKTVGVISTRPSDRAGVLAASVVARLVHRAVGVAATAFEATMVLADVSKLTVGISVAFDFEDATSRVARSFSTAFVRSAANVRIADAFDEWISDGFRRARAGESVAFRDADRVGAAGPDEFARVLTLSADTAFVVAAGGVGSTAFVTTVVLTDFAERAFRIDDTFDL